MSKEIVEHFNVQGITHWPPEREFPGFEPAQKDDSINAREVICYKPSPQDRESDDPARHNDRKSSSP